MKQLLKTTAATAALALGVSGANAAMLLHSDPQSGEKVVVDTQDPNYREEVIVGTDSTDRPANCPEGAYYQFEDPQTGRQVVAECAGDRRFLAEDIRDIPEGAFVLTEEPR